jgi:hypothetical protein
MFWQHEFPGAQGHDREEVNEDASRGLQCEEEETEQRGPRMESDKVRRTVRVEGDVQSQRDEQQCAHVEEGVEQLDPSMFDAEGQVAPGHHAVAHEHSHANQHEKRMQVEETISIPFQSTCFTDQPDQYQHE